MPAHKTTKLSLLPMQLRAGDVFTDAFGTWEVVAHPTTQRGGKTVKARVQQPGEPRTIRDESWPAHERITVTRAEKT